MRTICANAGVQRRTTTAASDGDGVGCEPDEPVAPPGTRYRLALLTEAGRPLEEVRRGESFEHVVSSPDLPVGIRTVFWICVNQSTGSGEWCGSPQALRRDAPYTGTWDVDPARDATASSSSRSRSTVPASHVRACAS